MLGIPVTAAPPDPVFALSARYKADTDPRKTSLGVGAYRDNDGRPWVLPVVRQIDQQLAADPSVDHEYLPLQGNVAMLQAAARLVFGRSADLSLVASCQTLGGTGANHMGAVLLSRFPAFGLSSKRVWVPAQTWVNHHQILGLSGFEVKKYPYWDASKRQLKFDALLATLDAESQPGDVLLLHACAHNPTGMDPTREQWKQIAALAQRKKLFVFFDAAYQGFASGSLEDDAWSVRYFSEQKIDLLVCQSFSKNMGLYGERCGALHVLLHSASSEDVRNVVSQLSAQTRAEVSNTPAYGARIAERILTTPKLFAQWETEVKQMAARIIEMRQALRAKLEALQTPGTWGHITDQIGMFSFTGLTEKQVRRLEKEFHIYMLASGRACMPGINTSNVDYVAECINKVVTEARL